MILQFSLQSKPIEKQNFCRGNFKILIIDDDCDVLRSLALTLPDLYEGINITTAESGVIGLSYIRDNGFKLILLDLDMPQMDGAQVLKKIRKIRPHYYVVIMTAYANHPLVATVKEIGCDGFLIKPFENDELHQHIQTVVQGRKDEE